MSSKKVRWIALAVLTGVNLLNYIDRYIFSALLEPIKRDLGFSDTQLGLLGSAFIFAYLFVSPVFGYFGDRGGRSKVMAMGAALWSFATALTGLATGFMSQLAARVAVGVGESAYSVIAPTTIADHFSRAARGKVFAIYSGALTVGSAFGFVLGGWLEPIVGWRHAFFVVGVPGLLLAVILFFLPDPKRGGDKSEAALGEGAVAEAAHDAPTLSQKQVYRKLFANGALLSTILGYAAYTFVVGGMSFWMPSYIVRYFDISLTKGNLYFGGVTVVGGFIGTLLGGLWADRIERRTGNGYLKVAVWSMVFAAPLFWFAIQQREFMGFIGALFVMEIALFLCISPLDAGVVSSVRPAFRATAMALNIFLIHFLGDGISRTLMGAISDASDLRTAVASLASVLVLAGVIWGLGIVLFWHALPWPKSALRLARLQAHRGYRPDGRVQENSLEAFRLAREAGAEMIELDVQLAADGEAVVFHDEDLRRLGSGRSERVLDLSSSEMKALVGAPRLSEVLSDPSVPSLVNIELKWGRVRGGLLEQAVAEAVRASGSESRVLFSSFNPFVLRRLSKLMPEVPRALLVSQEPHRLNPVWLQRMWLGAFARPHLIHVDEGMVTAKRLELWQERGIPVAVWTVNDRARVEELLALGASSVISDTVISETQAALPRPS
jgi:MFS family permease/glycerophosphoryl diester phosphodiesterase